MEQQKQHLSSHQQTIDRMKNDFESKKNVEELEKRELGNEEKSLQKGIVEEKRLIAEVENKTNQIEEHKKKFINEKEKEVEKELQKEKKNESTLSDLLSQEESSWKKAMDSMSSEKDSKNKASNAVDIEQAKYQKLVSSNEQLRQNIQEENKKQKKHQEEI